MLNLRLHSTFSGAPLEPLLSDFFLSPFMVTVLEDLAPAALLKNREHSEYVVIIPKSLHLGLRLRFIPPGMRTPGV